MLRELVKRATRNRPFRRRLSPEIGGAKIFVTGESQLKYLLPGARGLDVELVEAVQLLVKPQSVVWDIGANVGVFAFGAAKLASQGQVLAVEPDPLLCNLLMRSAKLNPDLRVTVAACAVSDMEGLATLQIAEGGRASNALKEVTARGAFGRVVSEVMVPTITLDRLLSYSTPPTVLKIDVEGAEILALQGAQRLLREVRPEIYIEVGNEQQAHATEILRAAGYRLNVSQGGQLVPVEQAAFNTFAFPE